MRFNYLKGTLKTSVLAVIILLFGASAAVAQQQINLTAGPGSITMPDGQTVPMWGYSCGTALSGSTATCALLNPNTTGWSPVVITVPTGQDLTINLTNHLLFGPSVLSANKIPTSLVIVGQLGAGLGNSATSTESPDHSNAQTLSTWPIVGANGDTGTPPSQGPRVQSFSTEVAAGATVALTWKGLRPGTYLLESGTHPSIQVPMGLYGILVVTTPPTKTPTAARGVAYPGVNYDAEIPMLFSEIDPVQNNAVFTAVQTPSFSETAVWSAQPGACGDPAVHTCYPPAVNYAPMYYLINGVGFDRANPSASVFRTSPPANLTPGSQTILVRLVNAGLRMHVPTMIGTQTGTPAVGGFSLIAEDGNPLPGVPRVQSEVFMAAGKTFDAMINVPPIGGSVLSAVPAIPIFDRELSLSGNGNERDAGMLAYIATNGALAPNAPGLGNAVARDDTYNAVVSCTSSPCVPLTVSDPAKGLISNDTNVYGVRVLTNPQYGSVVVNADGTFTYTPTANSGAPSPFSDSFTYCANGTVSTATPACSSGVTATVHLGAATVESASGISCTSPAFSSNLARSLKVKNPGLLSFCTDGAGYPLTVDTTSVSSLSGGGTLHVDANGGFVAAVTGPGVYTFSFKVKNSQGTSIASAVTAMLTFPTPNGPHVTVLDGKDKATVVSDYRWIIEEDRTYYVDPKCTTNPPPAGCPSVNIPGLNVTGIVPTFGTNFHTSYMPVVATGCTGTVSCGTGQTLQGKAAVCDVGDGLCRTDAGAETPAFPSDVVLDPTKRYYISVLPGDAANSFNNAGGAPVQNADGSVRQFDPAQDCDSSLGTANPCGHGMGGAPIPPNTANVTVYVQPNPYPSAKLSVFVFEDDFPLNGEQDAGGGIDVLATNEPGLGGFNITLFDDAGGTGDATGQMTYDMFNMPLSNSLAGTIDPATGNDACPISANSTVGADGTKGTNGITGTIVTCPEFESDGRTLSPLAGQAVVANMMPGRYGVVATPAADRIAKGEEWLQTNTLDGQKAHDSFLRVGEPAYFQEFGPAGYHVSIGFANPKIINSRLAAICHGGDGNLQATDCTHTVTGSVSTERMSRTPDERLYGSGSYDSFSFTQCYVSLGDTDGEDFAFTKCNANGNWSLSNIPPGNWRITIFDQWNDMLVDGLSTPVAVGSSGNTNVGQIAMNQWQANIITSTFFDQNGDGVRQANEDGLALVPTNIRFRDGSYSNFNNTDLNGNAGFNEVFPLFSWYVIETDDTRYKNTGTHVVYDAGGPADGCGDNTCGNSSIGANMANTLEQISVPTNLRVPGAVYCSDADCTNQSIQNGPYYTPNGSSGNGGSTGRIDPPWVKQEGWQGFAGQNSFVEFGKTPFAPNENGGIHGHVVYSSTRPFDDPTFLLQTSWEPLVPNVTINLYQESVASDNVTPTLKLVDTTKTSSWDDWAQGFRSDGVPNMNCPGQGRDSGTAADLFFFTLYNQPMWLDYYNNYLHANGNAPTIQPLPMNSQFKCYDGMHNWNQVQPAPYDGRYEFPSIAGRDPLSGRPVGGTGSVAGTNCTICIANPTDGTPMLPPGKYVVEVVVPPGYELVKEEDKNILIGDNYIAPVTQEFAGLGDIFILPDQAELTSSYNSTNTQNSTQALGRFLLPSNEGDTGSIESYWPCVGEVRQVPDYISLFPGSAEVSPFAGAMRPLCDRKEVTLTNEASVLAKFFIFTPTHAAAHFTGVITDDFTSEFDPFAPQYGEKFSPPNLPISIKDWTGTEISRVYSDQWGTYDGLTYSTWEVNPPNPTGYAPTMMITCMNDPGDGQTPDPLFNPEYSQFCYEIPFMPGQTQYMDTPVVPTSAFAGAGYNNPDCAYPAATPAISSVTSSDFPGPWVQAGGTGHTLTITALGDQVVFNNAYSGPSATISPYNQKTVTRHYGFGDTPGKVTIGGVSATVSSWSDTSVVVTVPTTVPACGIQQQAQYGGTGDEKCGQLVITAANGQQSIDTVMITVGGKKPTLVTPPSNPQNGSPFGNIQAAINAAAPGDLVIVGPGEYNEMLLMWKPIRLQGVGAASSVINANSQPAGRMTPWRQMVDCLFGLALNGQPYNTSTNANGGVPLPGGGGFEPLNLYDPSGAVSCPGTGWNYFKGGPNNPQVDRVPLEGILGWDVSLNGNLAELLQEPTLMGAYEGAGITVLGRGVAYPAGVEVFGGATDNTANANIAHEGQMPLGTRLLTSSTADCTNYTSNFQCNPSRIDGLSFTDSSQGGGGVYVHGWAHNLEISNNRIYNNTGTLTGGITVGQGESPDALLSGNEGDPIGLDQAPWSCISDAQGTNGVQNVSPTGTVANQQLPYCYNTYTNVHNNYVSRNSSIGDELFSSTPAGGGGVTFCTGSDYYKFNYNWVCGNLSTGDGGGLAHVGFSYNGDIEHNTFLFNQSTNPTVPTNGGGIIIMGAAPDGSQPGAPAGAECGSITDVDCAPGLTDGTGPNLLINANLILGNSADSGSGGGIRLQDVNGTEVGFFPLNPLRWNNVRITNNIIANNVAGWDGAGISLQDALRTDIIQNTVISNDTTASAGVLFNTLGAPLASAPGDSNQLLNSTHSAPQPAGLVTMQNTSLLTAAMPGTVLCPPGHGTVGSLCKNFSVPVLYNNVFWQNRAFDIGVGSLGTGTLNQQNVVALYNAFTGTRAASQPQANATAQNGNGTLITGGTGACVSGTSFWDIGVRGDLGPSNHNSGLTLAPQYSVLTDASDYPGNNNSGADPTVVSQYCNGSRVPPELGSAGYQVPPGISDATVPNPIFNLTPAATVDEGNNWINMSWGPLALVGPTGSAPMGNYSLAPGSPAIDYIPLLSVAAENTLLALDGTGGVPTTDFFGNPRPASALNRVDVGAVEFPSSTNKSLPTITPVALNFGSVASGHTSAAQTLTLTNPAGTGNLTGIALAFPAGYARATGAAAGTCGTTLNGGLLTNTTCTIGVVFTPPSATEVDGSLAVSASRTIAGSPVELTGAGVGAPTLTSISPNTGVLGASVAVTLTGTNFTTYGTTINVTGVTVSNVVVQNETTINATFTIARNAAVGAHTVTVTTGGGTTGSVSFSVRSATAAFSGPTPPLTTTTANRNAKTGTITVTNSATGANAGPLTITAAPTVTRTSGNGSFSIVAGGTCTAGTVLNPGGANNCTIMVHYVPPATGSNLTSTGHVTITGTGTNAASVNSPTFTGN